MTPLSLTLLLCLPAAMPGDFVLRKADGTTETGAWESLAEDWAVQLGAGRTPGARVIALRRAGTPLPAYPVGPQLLFVNGDRLAGTCGSLKGDDLAFTMAAGPEVAVPLSALAVLWLADPAGVDDPALWRRRLLAETRKSDSVVLRNGDRVEGVIVGLDKDALKLRTEANNGVSIERGKVAYVALNGAAARTLVPKVVYGRLTLGDGSRLSVASLRADGQKVTGQTLFKASFALPLRHVMALDLRHGAAVYLSDLKPASYEHVPWSDELKWPWVADGTVAGHDLRLAGGTHDKGIGLHAGSEITYRLDGEYQHFQALVGLDDRTGKEGKVRVRVRVDGKPRDLGWDGNLSAADGARAVQLTVDKAREITLVVERGRGGWWDTQGHVNWVDARLLQ